MFGISNAYVDEVLFAAGLFPFKRLTSLSEDELTALHQAVYTVPANAIPVLQKRMDTDIHKKVRDFLKVHGNGNQPCPTWGSTITHITSNGCLIDYRRTCQPGSLIGGKYAVSITDWHHPLLPRNPFRQVYSQKHERGSTT